MFFNNLYKIFTKLFKNKISNFNGTEQVKRRGRGKKRKSEYKCTSGGSR